MEDVVSRIVLTSQKVITHRNQHLQFASLYCMLQLPPFLEGVNRACKFSRDPVFTAQGILWEYPCEGRQNSLMGIIAYAV